MAKTAYTTLGDGKEKVLVCHGWFGDHTVFAPMMPYLDTNAFTYIFLNYRGYGFSRELEGEYTMEEIAGDAISILDELGIEQCHLIGHSMGGMAIQRIAIEAPERVKSMIALTPVPASGVPFDDEGWALFEGATANDENRFGIIDFTTGNRLGQAWVNYMVACSRAQTTEAAFAAYLVAWAKSDFASEVKGVDVPVKVLVGEHDPALNEDFMQQTFMEWYPNASLQVLPNCGHYPMQETPVWLASTIESYLLAH